MFGTAIGSLRITVLEARNLTNQDTPLIGKNDAYAILKCNHNKERTKTIKNAGSKATWNETFTFPIKDDSEIHLAVWDYDMIKDDLIGETKIPVQGLVQNGRTESWFNIGKGSKNSGEVLLRIEYMR